MLRHVLVHYPVGDQCARAPTSATLVAAVFVEGAPWPLCQPATVPDLTIRDNAIRAAEHFVKNNKLDTKRRCPKALKARDAQRTMEDEEPPLCQPYSVSESKATAVTDMQEIGWFVFIRKLDPEAGAARPTFRKIDVYPPGAMGKSVGEVCLRDIESELNGHEIVLGPK
jgi:hypothetical protein